MRYLQQVVLTLMAIYKELNNEEIRFFCSLNEVNYRRLNVYNNE